MLANSLKYPEANATRELLDSCPDDGQTMTLMAPSDGAVRKEINRLNKLLSDSGYPSLEEIGKNMSENTRPVEGLAVQMDSEFGALNVFHIMGAAAQLEQIAFAECNPWWNHSDESSAVFAEDDQDDGTHNNERPPDQLPAGMNISQWLLDWSNANMHYLILRGVHLAEDLPAHSFPETHLNGSGAFVELGGASQRMHLENATAACQMSRDAEQAKQNKAAYKDDLFNSIFMDITNSNLTAHPTGMVALFGPAGDPLTSEQCDRIRDNTTTDDNGDQYFSQVTVPDVICSNGVVQMVDRVIELPLNMSYVLYASGHHNFLDALNRTGLIDHIQNTPNITVFAPTDAFFNSKKAPNDEELRNWCMQQIVAGSFFSTDLKNQETLKSAFHDGSLKVSAAYSMDDFDAMEFDVSNPNDKVSNTNDMFQVNKTKLVKTNMLLRNGVMHFVSNLFNDTGARLMAAPLGSGDSGDHAGQRMCNGTDAGFFPPAPTCNLNASDLGCPAENRVCAVIDFDWLQCATQRDSLSVEDRDKCPENATTFGFPMTSGETVKYEIPIRATCYNVSTHVCTNGYQLCPVEAPSLCGVQCYNPSNYTCWQAFTLCPAEAPMRCGNDCYSPDKYECSQGRISSLNATAPADGGDDSSSGGDNSSSSGAAAGGDESSSSGAAAGGDESSSSGAADSGDQSGQS
jgi:uncharacterized surface protein with fasciclin (FAS1) repeats